MTRMKNYKEGGVMDSGKDGLDRFQCRLIALYHLATRLEAIASRLEAIVCPFWCT